MMSLYGHSPKSFISCLHVGHLAMLTPFFPLVDSSLANNAGSTRRRSWIRILSLRSCVAIVISICEAWTAVSERGGTNWSGVVHDFCLQYASPARPFLLRIAGVG